MKLKSIFAAAIVAATAFAIGAQATPLTWTVSTTGTITSGTDTSGLFGTQNQNLAGLDYTHTITASVDPSMYSANQINFAYEYFVFQSMSGTTGLAAFTDTVTVNGHTVSFNITQPTFEQQYVEAGHATWNADAISTRNQGSDTLGNTVANDINLFSYRVGWVPLVDFGQILAQPVLAEMYATDTFQVSGSNIASFNGNMKLLTVNADAPKVPEPMSIALFGVGLAGMAARRRRKKS